MRIDEQPLELVIKQIENVGIKDLLNLKLVNSKFNKIIKNNKDHLYGIMIKREYGITGIDFHDKLFNAREAEEFIETCMKSQAIFVNIFSEFKTLNFWEDSEKILNCYLSGMRDDNISFEWLKKYYGLNLKNAYSSYGFSPLTFSVSFSYPLGYVQKILECEKEERNKPDLHNLTAMDYAVENGDKDMINIL